jgi:hypothetical protein
MDKTPKINQVWYVDLSPSRGREIGGVRKCLVVDDFGDGLYQIAPYTPFGKSKTTKLLKDMAEKGVVAIVGKGKGTKYIIK